MNCSIIKTKKTYVKCQWVFWSFDILYYFRRLYKLYGSNLNFWAQSIIPKFFNNYFKYFKFLKNYLL